MAQGDKKVVVMRPDGGELNDVLINTGDGGQSWGDVNELTTVFEERGPLSTDAGKPGQMWLDTAHGNIPYRCLSYDGARAVWVYTGGCNPNLLDNAYFVNPVNQRNVGSGVKWGAGKYGLDRWVAAFDDAVYWSSDGYVHIDNARSGASNTILCQVLERYYSGPITLSALTKDGRLFTGSGTGRIDVRIPADSGNVLLQYWDNMIGERPAVRVWNITSNYVLDIVAVKFELGTTQTLAYQDENGQWQIIPGNIPDYGEELAKCQAYQWTPSPGNFSDILGFGIVSNTRSSYFSIPCPVPMRVQIGNVTVTWLAGDISKLRIYTDQNVFIRATGIISCNATMNTIFIAVSHDEISSELVGHPTVLRVLADSPAQILFDQNV